MGGGDVGGVEGGEGEEVLMPGRVGGSVIWDWGGKKSVAFPWHNMGSVRRLSNIVGTCFQNLPDTCLKCMGSLYKTWLGFWIWLGGLAGDG